MEKIINILRIDEQSITQVLYTNFDLVEFIDMKNQQSILFVFGSGLVCGRDCLSELGRMSINQYTNEWSYTNFDPFFIFDTNNKNIIKAECKVFKHLLSTGNITLD